MKRTNRALLALVAVAAVAGCAAGPGTREGDTPPRMAQKTNWDGSTTLTWDDPSAFGPVPANLAEKGKATCAGLDTKDTRFVAVGYHSQARDADGQTFPEGGYLCRRA